jgi:hypothetical protein
MNKNIFGFNQDRICFSLLLVILLFFVGSCVSHEMKDEPNYMPIENLLIGETDLPNGWITDSKGPHRPSGQAPLGGGIGGVETTILLYHKPIDDGNGSGGAYEEIRRFKNSKQASDAYDYKVDIVTNSKKQYWAVDNNTVDNFISATSYNLRCEGEESINSCRFLALYNVYLVEFNTDFIAFTSELDEVEVLTFDQFLQILQSINKKMKMVNST